MTVLELLINARAAVQRRPTLCGAEAITECTDGTPVLGDTALKLLRSAVSRGCTSFFLWERDKPLQLRLAMFDRAIAAAQSTGTTVSRSIKGGLAVAMLGIVIGIIAGCGYRITFHVNADGDIGPTAASLPEPKMRPSEAFKPPAKPTGTQLGAHD